MNCSCVYVGDTEDGQYMLKEKDFVARKQHVCCECGSFIMPKEQYTFEQMVYEGRIDTFKTCSNCMSVRNEMFCNSWWYEQMWDNVKDHIESVGGDISEKCLLSLTLKARFKVLNLIDSLWG